MDNNSEYKPHHDSPAWREIRDLRLRTWIGDEAAVQFILLLGTISELWDDLIDKDKIRTDEEINRGFQAALLDLPANPFFDRYKAVLLPVLRVGVNAWLDSNTLEKRGSYNDLVQAYVLRSWYIEIISLVVEITKGSDYLRFVSMEIRDFFSAHESFDDYRSSK